MDFRSGSQTTLGGIAWREWDLGALPKPRGIPNRIAKIRENSAAKWSLETRLICLVAILGSTYRAQPRVLQWIINPGDIRGKKKGSLKFRGSEGSSWAQNGRRKRTRIPADVLAELIEGQLAEGETGTEFRASGVIHIWSPLIRTIPR